MQVSLIQVPYMVGDDRHSDSDGTQHLLQNGAANIFTSNGFTVSVDQVERGTTYRDSATASLAVNKNLKKTVQRAVVAEQIPIVLAGSCDVSAGILAGFDHSRCGVVWLDAHGDFNTPESTISGFFAGMSLAVITGHCYRSYWAQIGDNTPVLESATVIFGVRDLDPAEQQRFQQSQIRMVKWRDGNPQGDVQTILDDLTKRVDDFYPSQIDSGHLVLGRVASDEPENRVGSARTQPAKLRKQQACPCGGKLMQTRSPELRPKRENETNRRKSSMFVQARCRSAQAQSTAGRE